MDKMKMDPFEAVMEMQRRRKSGDDLDCYCYVSSNLEELASYAGVKKYGDEFLVGFGLLPELCGTLRKRDDGSVEVLVKGLLERAGTGRHIVIKESEFDSLENAR